MNIAIFGSCVSRDTCELMPEASVVTYVARQSVTSLESPHGKAGINLSGLDSSFQRRMATSDLEGTGAERIVQDSEPIDLVLLDLVDERRGYWQFPDGTTMTNSLELESCGATAIARERGANLIDFGSDQHFEVWKGGFSLLAEHLRNADLLSRTVFLDIEWAQAIDSAPHPKSDLVSRVGRNWRRTQRGARDAYRQVAIGRGLRAAWDRFRNVGATESEEFADRALRANQAYVRYRSFAKAKIPAAISRSSEELRISSSHKWGPQPFHYRGRDYASIVEGIHDLVQRFPGRKDSE